MKKFVYILPLILVIPAFADDAKLAEIAHKTAVRDTLRADLLQIQREKDRCERQRRNWQTATIVGGVGVATTATIGIIQGNQLRNQREASRERANPTAAQ